MFVYRTFIACRTCRIITCRVFHSGGNSTRGWDLFSLGILQASGKMTLVPGTNKLLLVLPDATRPSMKILTWNINGIRATPVPLKRLFYQLDADIICLQETKVTRDQLDEPSAIVEGYSSYFSFSQVRQGYSGVATFVKDEATPVKAEEGLSGGPRAANKTDVIGFLGDQSNFPDDELEGLDKEGRCVMTQHRIVDKEGEESLLTIINVYCPRADPERDDRKAFKLRFYQLLQIRAEAILRSGSHVVIVGDVNMSHQEIDHADPDEGEFWNNPGRLWLHQFLVPPDGRTVPPDDPGGKFVDTFRHFHPDQEGAFTCWSTVTGARATNYGARIDYILADREFADRCFTDCVTMPEVEGSDHCPVKATLSCEIIPFKKCPSLCSKFLPEFAGKQQKLSSFFTKVTNIKSVSIIKDSSVDDVDSSGCSSKSDTQDEGLNPSVKRSQPESSALAKRPKLSKSGSGSSKQGTLSSFFMKKKEGDSTSEPNKPCQADSKMVTPVGNSNSTERLHSVKKDCSVSNVSNAWKTLLSGPPPAPLCKGHKEPCVLRTVKKDSLNKGRQFYVCGRPEGHKSNPDARCDTFVWVEKGKGGLKQTDKH